MDQLEEKFRITNYYEHPTDNRYIIFHYYKEEQAKAFEDLLTHNNVPYEKHIEEKTTKYIYLFAVSKKYYKSCVRYNFLAIGKHRKPFIPNRVLGFILLILVFAVITLAVISYFKNQNRLLEGLFKPNTDYINIVGLFTSNLSLNHII